MAVVTGINLIQIRLDISVNLLLPVFYRKGIGKIFPNMAWENAPRGAVCGNANELGDIGGSSGKSSLFLLRKSAGEERKYQV